MALSKAASKPKPIVVIKVGGDVLLGEAERNGLASNVKDMVDAGWRVIILHGGGPQVDRLQTLHGLLPKKIGGRRITSRDDLLVIKQAICGQVNIELSQLLQDVGINAFGCSGLSGKLIQAVHRQPIVISGAGSEPVDFGEAGDVIAINTDLLLTLTDADLVPVIATLGVEANKGRVFNINADTTAVKIAQSLQADLLLLTSSVGGVYQDLNDAATRLKTIDPKLAKQLIDDGVIQGGMIPKVEEALSVITKGVKSVAIVGPQTKGAFLSIVRGEQKHGTRFTAN